MRVLLACLLMAAAAEASYSHWAFGTASGKKWTSLETEITWSRLDEPNATYVFYSQQMWWGASAGYFGTQRIGDKGFAVIFSMWDGKAKNSARWPAEYDGVCSRFGGEGEGSHCLKLLPEIELGKTYNIKIYNAGNNGTGTLWGFNFTDKAAGTTKQVGALYFDEQLAGESLGDLSPAVAGFQEYYLGYKGQSSALVWNGPVGTDAEGTRYPPTSASCEANGDLEYCAACADGIGCGPNPPVFVLNKGAVTNTSTVTWISGVQPLWSQ